MRLPPPGSTLFPYTTLFRSSVGRRPELREAPHEARLQVSPDPRHPDRKGTRLTSRHVSGAYGGSGEHKELRGPEPRLAGKLSPLLQRGPHLVRPGLPPTAVL